MAGKEHVGIMKSFILPIAVATALGGVGGSIYGNATTPKPEEIKKYEAAIGSLVLDLKRNGLDVRDIARDAAERAVHGDSSVYNGMADIFSLRPEERVVVFHRLEGRIGREVSASLEKFLSENPSFYMKMPGIKSRIDALNKIARDAKPIKEGYRNRQDRMVRQGGFAGAVIGASALYGLKKKDALRKFARRGR